MMNVDGDGAGKWAETELTFNLSDWMKDLMPDVDVNSGMDNISVQVPLSSAESFNQQTKAMNFETQHIATTKLDFMPGQFNPSKLMISSSDDSNDLKRQSEQPSTLSNMYLAYSQSQPSRMLAMQAHQHKQVQHQCLTKTTCRPNIQPFLGHSSTGFSNQIQQWTTQNQNTASRLLQQPQRIGSHSNFFTMQSHRSFGGPQPSQQLPSQISQSSIQTSEPHQTNQSLDKQSDLVPEASSDSTSQMQLTNSGNWYDEAFQRIQLMKQMHLADLIKSYNKAQEVCLQTTNPELLARCGRSRNIAKNLINFLHISKPELLHYQKEKFDQHMNNITQYINQSRAKSPASVQHRQQQLQLSGSHSGATPPQQSGSTLQLNRPNPCPKNSSTGVSQLFAQQVANMNFQSAQRNPLLLGSSTGLEMPNASSLLHQHQHYPVRSTKQSTTTRRKQGRVMPSIQKGFPGISEQRAPSLPQHPSSGVAYSCTFGFLQQTGTPNSILIPSQQIKQQEQLHVTQTQKMKQPLQRMLIEKNKQHALHKVNEDTNLRNVLGSSERLLLQHQSISQQMEHSAVTSVQSSSSSYHMASPQASLNSSPLFELKEFSSKVSKSTPSLPSISSPLSIPSPLTPLTPSSVPVDPDRSTPCSYPLSLEESEKHPKTPCTQAQLQSEDRYHNRLVITNKDGFLESPLPSDPTCANNSQQSNAQGEPFEHLMKVVKSASPEALKASLLDIDAVINIMDRTAGSDIHHESRKAIGQDLADDIRYFAQQQDFSMQSETLVKTGIKRQRHNMDSHALLSPLQKTHGLDQTSEEVDANFRMKLQKIKANNTLLQEVQEINRELIETMVDIMDDMKYATTAESEQGTIITCCYNPVRLHGDIKFPNLLLQLRISADYPDSSPIILNGPPPACREADEARDLWMKTKTKFSMSIRKLSGPMSLREMAKTWDACAREVFLKYAEQMGGGSFGSKYGKWEDCIAAA